MSDIVGSDSEKFEFCNFNLIELSDKTKQWWCQPKRSLLHNTILCIMSMRLSHKNVSEIKKKIYHSIGNENKTEFTRKNFIFKDSTLLSYGLSKEQIRLIREVLNISLNKELEIKDLMKIKGIGIWTIKMLKMLMDIDSDISLYQDYYIRKNLSILYDYKKIITLTEAKKILETWKGNQSQICYFLWKLKHDSVLKIQDEQDLNQYDFLGYDKKEQKE